MRRFLLVAAAGFASLSASQGLQVAGRRIELSPPNAVAVGVTEVFWKDDGRALAYYAQDADGSYLGVYDVERGKAKELLRFAEGTNVHFEGWLPSRSIYLIAVSQKVDGDATREWSIHALDAERMSVKELWSNEFLDSEQVTLELDVSPSLDHAIVTVTDPNGRVPIVVLNGAVNAVMSRDLAAAWAEGAAFAGWSVDGTAYFTAAQRASEITLTDTLTTGLQNGVFTFEVKLSGNELLSGIPIIGKLFRGAPVAPVAGTPVYELMPGNAALRPVLSRGPFRKPEVFPHVVYPIHEETVAVSKERRDGTGALWLVRLTGIEGEPYGRDGLLISGHAGKFWMCDDGNWIAYESGGALFVRRITYGGRPFSDDLVKGG